MVGVTLQIFPYGSLHFPRPVLAKMHEVIYRKVYHVAKVVSRFTNFTEQSMPVAPSKNRALLSSSEESELLVLWEKRPHLGDVQWTRLWELVSQALNRCHPSVLRQLPDDKADYIHQFFLYKVLEAKDNGTSLTSAAALASFFNNFLIDVQRYQARRPTTYIEDESALDGVASEDEGAAAMDLMADNEDPSAQLDAKRMLESAANFVQELSEEDKIYLSLNTCCDECESEALYKLAERHRISSYHYKAGQLGITRKKGELPDGYERTRIGSWLGKTLGLHSASGWASPVEILGALNALCTAVAYLIKVTAAGESHA